MPDVLKNHELELLLGVTLGKTHNTYKLQFQ